MNMRVFRTGAFFGALPALLVAAVLSVANPWFLDRPLLYIAVAALPLALVCGAALAYVMRRKLWEGLPAMRFAFLLMGLLYLAMASRPRPNADGVKVLVMGIDGATFDIVEPMIEGGDLPALKALGQRGTSSVLTSMEPMFSPLLWTTMATGKPPEDHGIHGFHVHATDCQVPRIWDIAADEGLGIGIYKWLVTWPPRPVDGFIVPAWLAPSPETWPVDLSFVKEIELANRLKRKSVAQVRSNYELVAIGMFRGLRFGTVWDATLWTVRERLTRPNEQDRQVALQLLRGRIDRDVFSWSLSQHQPELATFTYYATDGLAHIFWRAFRPDDFGDVDPQEVAKYGDAIPEAYRQADAILGELMGMLSDDARVVVVSDHGFQALQIGSDKTFFAPLTERLQARMTEEVGEVDVSKLGVKLNVGLADDALDIDEVQVWIEALVDESGEPFFRVEPVPGSSRALGLTLVDEYVTAERIAAGTVGDEPLKQYVKLTEAFTGEHREDGVFYAAGPEIPKNRRLTDAHLLDVSPTVQAMLDIQPASDLPGRVLILDDDRRAGSRDRLVDSLDYGELGRRDDGEVNEDLLEQLGYIEGED